MFSKTDGPTALRAELVRALSFAQATIERNGAEGKVSSVAALAGVWNGRKGYVALLVRDVEPAALERYVTDGPISNEADLDGAVQEGLAFAESMGFAMDAHEFKALDADAREARMYRWNKLRKLRKPTAPTAGEAPLELPELPPVPAGYEIGPDELSVPAPAAPIQLDLETSMTAAPAAPPASAAPSDESAAAQAAAGAPPSMVLGRISLVRRSGRLDLVARLLAFY